MSEAAIAVLTAITTAFREALTQATQSFGVRRLRARCAHRSRLSIRSTGDIAIAGGQSHDVSRRTAYSLRRVLVITHG
jgi:hypothetical protein